MKITSATLYRIAMPMRFTFTTAKVALPLRETMLVEVVTDEGIHGWGECVAFSIPFYTKETIEEARQQLSSVYLPALVGCTFQDGLDVKAWLRLVECAQENAEQGAGSFRTPMARAAVENALLAALSEQAGEGIVPYVFGEPLAESIPLGVVLGDMPEDFLLAAVQAQVDSGCRRIKIKVKPGDGWQRVAAVRKAFPELTLLVDGNRSFTVAQWKKVQAYDALSLACFEEPFAVEDWKTLADLQRCCQTPFCLDESVQSLTDLQAAAEEQAVQMVNIKVGKLGGLYPTRDMIAYCRQHHIQYWIGSMVESGVSKHLHAQLAALSGVAMPGDISDSARYFKEDLTSPALAFTEGRMPIGKRAGLGVTIKRECVLRYTTEMRSWP